jgi:hypothetical protein
MEKKISIIFGTNKKLEKIKKTFFPQNIAKKKIEFC